MISVLRSKPFLYLYASLIIFISVVNYRTITSYNLSAWFPNYHDGVLRRALIGTLLNIDGNAVFSQPRNLILTVCIIGILIFAYTLVYLTITALRDNSDEDTSAYAYLIIAFALLGSGALTQYTFDIGRFDVFGGLLLLVGAWFFIAGRKAGVKNHTNASLLVLTVLSALALLIHEAYVVWVFPFFVSFWWLDSHKQTADVIKLGCATVFMLSLIWLVSYFSYDRVTSYEQALQLLGARTSNEIGHKGLIVHYRGLADNVVYSLGIILTKRRALSSVIAMLVMLPQLSLYYLLLQQLRTRQIALPEHANRGYKLLDLSLYIMPLTPLFLSFFGHDQGRWFSMASVSFVLASIVFIAKLGWHSVTQKPVIAALILSSILLAITQGPFGVQMQLPLSGLRDIAFKEALPQYGMNQAE